jgi:hypothetical protein
VTRPDHLPARESEAYLQLLKDLNKILAEDWDEQPQIEVKEKFNRAMHDSLNVYI